MSYLTQEIQELEAEKQEKMNELFPSQYGELEHLTEEIYRLRVEIEKRYKTKRGENQYTKESGSLPHVSEANRKREKEPLNKAVNELQEEVACETEQKQTHCNRCEEAFHELNEESGVREGWCSYCEQVGQWNE